MTRSVRQRQALSSVLVACALAAACGEAPLGPGRTGEQVSARNVSFGTAVNLGTCQNLQVPAGSRLVFRVYASGVQIYNWNGSTWRFAGPLAVLTADREGNSTVGTHYAGPTWESMSGGKIVGTLLQRCTADPAAIDWLLLAAVPDGGPGIFHRVAYIQRVHTVGGLAPSYNGSVTGEEARVPYTTEYLFYRAD